MTDRDRLATDLHTVIAGAPGLGDRPDLWLASADRLIALGWTREEHHTAAAACPICRVIRERPPIDEERLARALQAVWHETPNDLGGIWKSNAKAIAKAYREDTE